MTRSKISSMKSKEFFETPGSSEEGLEKKFLEMVKAAREKSDKMMRGEDLPFAMTSDGLSWLTKNPRAAIAIMALGTVGTLSVMSNMSSGKTILEPARKVVDSFFDYSGAAASQFAAKAAKVTVNPQKWAEATYGAFASRIVAKLAARRK